MTTRLTTTPTLTLSLAAEATAPSKSTTSGILPIGMRLQDSTSVGSQEVAAIIQAAVTDTTTSHRLDQTVLRLVSPSALSHGGTSTSTPAVTIMMRLPPTPAR